MLSLIESPLLTERFLHPMLEEMVPENQRSDVLAMFQNVRPFLALAREALSKQNLASIFEPLNRLAASEPEANAEETFSVPSEDSVANQNVNPNGLEPGRRLGDFRCEHWMSRP